MKDGNSGDEQRKDVQKFMSGWGEESCLDGLSRGHHSEIALVEFQFVWFWSGTSWSGGGRGPSSSVEDVHTRSHSTPRLSYGHSRATTRDKV